MCISIISQVGQANFQTCLPGGQARFCTLIPSLATSSLDHERKFVLFISVNVTKIFSGSAQRPNQFQTSRLEYGRPQNLFQRGRGRKKMLRFVAKQHMTSSFSNSLCPQDSALLPTIACRRPLTEGRTATDIRSRFPIYCQFLPLQQQKRLFASSSLGREEYRLCQDGTRVVRSLSENTSDVGST